MVVNAPNACSENKKTKLKTYACESGGKLKTEIEISEHSKFKTNNNKEVRVSKIAFASFLFTNISFSLFDSQLVLGNLIIPNLDSKMTFK